MSESLNSFLRSRLRNSGHSLNSLLQLKSLIDREIESKQKKTSEHRIRLKVSRGLWRSDKRLVEVIVNKNISQWMISTIDSIKYLDPFSALYLMENHSLEVVFNEIPLSIEESLKLFLQNEEQINCYRIFATLIRSGYFVKKHISSKSNEMISDRKRKLSESDIDSHKRLEYNTNYYELSSQITNYKRVENIRSILLRTQPMTKTLDPKIQQKSTDCQHLTPKSVIYEIKDNESPVELDPTLKLFSGEIKPLCDLGVVYSNEELFNLIQSYGPKPMNKNVSETEFNITFDVFKNLSKKVNKSQSLSLIITKSDEQIPQINDIIGLNTNIESNQIYFAVLDKNDFVFYSMSCLQLKEEIPVLWEKHFKPIKSIQ